jgi:hypothetical protein
MLTALLLAGGCACWELDRGELTGGGLEDNGPSSTKLPCFSGTGGLCSCPDKAGPSEPDGPVESRPFV